MKAWFLSFFVAANLVTASNLSSAFAEDKLPDYYPIWMNPARAPEEYLPNREDSQTLASWCYNVTKQFAEKLDKDRVQNIQCTFLVSQDGKIQDPFIWFGRKEVNEKYVVDSLIHLDPLPTPPSCLGQRGLLVRFGRSGPQVDVDLNQHNGLAARQYFWDEIRKKHM